MSNICYFCKQEVPKLEAGSEPIDDFSWAARRNRLSDNQRTEGYVDCLRGIIELCEKELLKRNQCVR